jgi:hypothetical protein
MAAPNSFFIRNLFHRNDINDLNQSMLLVEKYIKAVKLLQSLEKKQIRRIILSLRVDLFLKALNNNEFKFAIKYYFDNNLGIKGLLLSITKTFKYYLITRKKPI